MKKYFIVYTYRSNSGVRMIGNYEVEIEGPIICLEDIKKIEAVIQADLEEKYGKSVFIVPRIINWQRFDDHEGIVLIEEE